MLPFLPRKRDLLAAGLILALLCGCVRNAPYRTVAALCEGNSCQANSIERHRINTEPPTDYLLGVVEFDDQGAKYAPDQMDALFRQLKIESASQDLCMVVFVHGWEHNASADDPNLRDFNLLLEQLARTEGQHAPGAWNRPRKVVGIYAGWRGKSLDAGDVADLTFWDRKAAAGRVALGSIRELLGRARAFRDTTDRTTWSNTLLPAGAPAPAGDPLRSTRLLTIGHSFGGLIVYTALAQYFIDRAAASAMAASLDNATDADKSVPGYGDLVVIINPAVEAISWEPMRQLVQNRKAQSYARGQKPVFVEVTSSADDATGVAFPAGRWLDTLTESFISDEEGREALASIGHYPPFWTHDLTSAPDAVTQQQAQATHAAVAQAAPAQAAAASNALVHAECQAHADFDKQWRHDGYLADGWTRRYTAGAVLSHRAQSVFDANDPFWVVNADKSVIADHSDISKPVFVDFIRQLYDELLLDGDNCPPAR